MIVAASGDSYSLKVADIATHFTVYPAAFYRVITATGATYGKGPTRRAIWARCRAAGGRMR